MKTVFVAFLHSTPLCPVGQRGVLFRQRKNFTASILHASVVDCLLWPPPAHSISLEIP